MSVRLSWTKVLFIFFAIIVLNVNYSLLHLETYDYYVIVFILAVIATFIVIIEIVLGIRRTSYKLFFEGIKSFLLPWFIVTVISVITAINVYETNIQGDYLQSIRKFVYVCFSFLFAYIVYRKFGKQSLFMLAIAGFISYATVIFRWIYVAKDFETMLHPFNNVVEGVTLEVHELTYIFGILFLYFLLSQDYTKHQKRIICGFLLVGIFLGNKRALYIGLAISLFVYWLFHKFENRQKRYLLIIICLLYFAILFGWLYIVKSGMLELFMFRYGINTSSRFRFWNYFRDIYEITPNYFGRGMSYTDNVLATKLFQETARISGSTNMHNDILKSYIGWGFIPFVYYYFNFFVLQTKKFIKLDKGMNAWKYFTVISCVLYVYFFDNMIDAIGFNLAIFLIWFALMDTKEKMIVTSTELDKKE